MEDIFPEKAKKIMNERFGRDTLIALATLEGNIPLKENPDVGICGEWFTAHGKGRNLGWFCKEENNEIAQKMRKAFGEWTQQF